MPKPDFDALAQQMVEATRGAIARAEAALIGRIAELDARLKAIPAGPRGEPGPAGESIKGEKGDANEAVIKALVEAGRLLARGRLKHQYPHSWRSKKPVIFRNTPQWFIAMDKPIADDAGKVKRGDSLRARALEARGDEVDAAHPVAALHERA